MNVPLDKAGPRYAVEPDTGCWVWLGHLNEAGYPTVSIGRRTYLAHRVAYELLAGPTNGMTLDHLCRNKACMNPAHLEPVTLVENIRRAREVRTHCRRGHDLTGAHINGKGARVCQECRSMRKSPKVKHIPDHLITAPTVAKILETSPAVIRSRVARGVMVPNSYSLGGRALFDRTEIEHLAASRFTKKEARNAA